MSVVEKLYIPLAKSIDLPPNEDGTLVYHIDDKNSMVVKVDDLPWVMPIRERLNSTGLTGVVAFHPLSENIIRGESPVLRKLRAAIVNKITQSLGLLALSMIDIAADVDFQQKLKASESDFLRALPNADAKLVNAFAKVLDNVQAEGNNRLVRMFFKRGGVWKGDKYSRVTVVSFPIVEAAHDDTKELFGVKLRVNDKKQIQDLLEYLLPNSQNPADTYDYGSSNKSAPYFDSLLGAYVNLAEQINKHAKKLKKHLPEYESIIIDTSWYSEMANIDKLALEIPPLNGNEGDVGLEEKHKQDVATGSVAAQEVAETHTAGRAGVNMSNKFVTALAADVGSVNQPNAAPAAPAPAHPTTQFAPVSTPAPAYNAPAPAYNAPAYNTPAQPAGTGGLTWAEIQAQNQRSQPVQQSAPAYNAPQYGAQQRSGYPSGNYGSPQYPQNQGYGQQQQGYGRPAYSGYPSQGGYGHSNDPGRATPTYS